MIERKGKRYLTRRETSDKLTEALGRGYTIRSVDRLIERRVLTGQKFDGLQWVFIPEAKVDQLIASRPRQITPDTPTTPPPARRRTRKTTLVVPGMTRVDG